MHGWLPHFVVTLNFLVSKDSSSKQQLIPSFISIFINYWGHYIYSRVGQFAWAAVLPYCVTL